MGTKWTKRILEKSEIYVISLADHKCGRILGRWIDAAQKPEAIHAAIEAILAESHEPVAEGWTIYNYEGFGRLSPDKFDSIEKLAEVAKAIQEHGHIVAELAIHLGGISQLEKAKRYMAEGYRGEFDSVQDYVEQFVEQCYGEALAKLPAFLRRRIDYDAIGHDLELGGDIIVLQRGDQFHVFDAILRTKAERLHTAVRKLYFNLNAGKAWHRKNWTQGRMT